MVFKCKMCGGDITPIANTNTGKCEYCKSVMTLPNLDDEKIVNLYNRANDFRINNDFDKALEIYENILNIDDKQIEAYWGVLLCKYGVEYVDDPKTKKKIPTCHRTMADSILIDKYYKKIVKESYGEALSIYQEEAKNIDEIQKHILSISLKEKPYDVFICYKETDEKGERTYDSVIAQDIYDKLIDMGFKVFFARITLEDKLGSEYEPYIYSALRSSKVMLVVGTKEEHFNAVWVKNEWSRYLEMMKEDKRKSLIPVYSKVDAYKLPEEFSMLQAQSMDKVGAIQDLTRGVKKLVEENKTEDIDGVDKETVAKVKAALDESRSIGNGRYEVSIVKETLPIWYYILCILAIGVYTFVRFGASNNLYFTHLITYRNSSLYRLSPLLFIIENAYTIILALYFICLAIKRKTHKFAKKMVPILLFITLIRFPIMAMKLIFPITERGYIYWAALFLFACDIAAIIISYIIVPKWNLNMSAKTIMTGEEKDKQVKKNAYIKDNFKNKEKNKENMLSKKVILILVVILILFSIIAIVKVYKYLPNLQSNIKDDSKTQITISVTETLYEEADEDSKTVLKLRRYGVYDILNVEELKVNKRMEVYGYAKVRTNMGFEGYIYIPENASYVPKITCAQDDTYCNNLFKITNDRDTSVKQVEVIVESLNIRSDHSTNSSVIYKTTKGDIFTVLEEYNQDIEETRWNDDLYSDNFGPYKVIVETRHWYHIKTTNGLEGWICGNYEKDQYLKVLDKD